MAAELMNQTRLFDQWKDRWSDFLTDIEDAGNAEEIERKLRDKVTIGNAERRIAGGHEGREILELLQNARDAIRRGSDDEGHVYVGVYDEGVMVANTGSRFNIFHPKVEKAVTMIGETGKGDDDTHSIGHKGVGLKSILATGDSFEIYTRPEEDLDDILGIKLSRSYLLGAILARLGEDLTLDELVQDIEDPELESLIRDCTQTSDISLDAEIKDALSKLPLFNFPAPVDVENSSDRAVQRARRLLQEDTGTERFRSVVFVRYTDDNWRELLDEYDISLPDEGSGSLEDRADRIWDYLAQSETRDGLRKETLVQLGGIDSLRLERHSNGTGGAIKTEEWQIHRSGDTAPQDQTLHHETVEVQIEGEDTSQREVFDQFRFRNDTNYGVSLLVGKETTTKAEQYPREYPLYLYYPIQNTATTSFPFCLHGRFRVETNRKDLSNNNINENQDVLREALELIEAVSVETAQTIDSEEPYGDAYPWILLPPVPESVPDDPTTQSELLRWFCAQLYEKLQSNPNIPLATANEPTTPADTLLHWNPRTLASYRAVQQFDAESPPTDLKHLPAGEVITAYQSFPSRWTARLQELLLADEDGIEYTESVVRDWASTLSTRLSGFEEQAIRVETPTARNLLYGLVDLVFECTNGDDEIESLLGDLSDSLEGTYLLPCVIPREDDTDELQLVPIERRQSPQGERARGIQSRSVIWDLRSASRTTTPPSPPSRGTNFTVYFLDSHIEQDESVHKLLSLAGRLWGIRAYEGIPSFVRSLLDAFAFGTNDVIEKRDFAFLTAVTQNLTEDSTDLRVGEGAYFPTQYLNSAIKQSEGDQRRNLERRVQLRDCSVRLSDEETPLPIRTTALGDDWQSLLVNGDDEQEGSEFTSLSYPNKTWPGVTDTPWKGIQDIIQRDTSPEDLARTLSLLGAAAFPGLRTVWMYGDDHPDMRRSPNWNPKAWPEEEFSSSAPVTIDRLIESLDKFDDAYQDWITAPGFHPQETAGHSAKCDVKVDGVLEGTNLAAWVWCDDVDLLEDLGVDVIPLLQRHGDSLLTSLLRTGWSCNNGHKTRRDWNRTVPTLFNWQLRGLDAWETVLSIHEDVEEQWGEDDQTLEYAVQAGSSRGAQAARLFPSLNPESDDVPSTEVLSALGVESVDGLNSTQAARRLQKLQEVLATEPLDESPTQLRIPSGRENDWNQAYTKLLKPLMRRLPEENPDEATFADGGFLTHFPIVDGETWVSIPIQQLRDIAPRQVRYFQDQSAKPWEKHAIAENDYYVLQHTSEGPFVRLANHLGVTQVEASKPVIKWTEAQSRLLEDGPMQEHIAQLQGQLLERRDLLVASTERSQEDEIRETADEFRTAIDQLVVVESFPDAIERQLSDPASGLYRTADDQIGLAFNQSACAEPPELQSLAMGLALLVERPTNVATFREALQKDVEVSELETRWERLTFPINTVKQVLGTELSKELDQRFAAVIALFDQLEITTELDVETGISELADADSGVTEAAKRWFGTGGSPPEVLTEYEEVCELGQRLHETIPDQYQFVLQQLFLPTESPSWQAAIQAELASVEDQLPILQWLLNNTSMLGSRPINPAAQAGWQRLLTAVEVWSNTDVTELSEVATWQERVKSFEGATELDWTSHVPSIVNPEGDDRLLFHLATEEGLGRACDAFVTTVEAKLSENPDGIKSALTQYLSEGEFPEVQTTGTGARKHQEQAFEDIQNQLISSETDDTTWDGLTGEVSRNTLSEGALTVSEGSGSGGGGSKQYTGRGQQAEVFTIVSVLDRLAQWLEENPGGMMRLFKSRLRQLHDDQQGKNYKWHVENAWQSGLLDALNDPELLNEEALRDWRTHSKETQLSNLPMVRLLNVTLEQGPGFDIIDPFGPLDSKLNTGLDAIQFTPVEVKAVGGTNPPFHFRLTTNEYRRCKAFLSQSEAQYVIRLVYIPEPNTPNWAEQSAFVGEKVLETPAELERLIDRTQFERVVKGGYMNMSLE